MKFLYNIALLLVLLVGGFTDVSARIIIGSTPHLKGRLRETGRGWPACDPDVPQWSGYFDIPGHHHTKHYFFWAFGPRSGRADAPVILWMTGGPGCSSSFALLVENGPCLVNTTTGSLDHNPYGWNKEAYLVFIDQPAGVGFSYADKEDYDVNQAQVSDDMYHFLQAFLTAHRNLRTNELFVLGESYGGHYAPATAHRILRGNQAGEGAHINLAGMATGNGLTDSFYQYPSYPDMAYHFCKAKLGKPCISEHSYELMKSSIPRCERCIRACNRDNSTAAADACRQANTACNAIPYLYEDTGLNPYDIRKPCDYDLCYDFSKVDVFMNRPEVQASLGVNRTQWQSCNMEVNSMFGVDWFKNFNYTVPALLDAGVRVMVYAGDLDFICNWIGNLRWTMNLEWEGQSAFREAFEVPFTSADGNYGGTTRSVTSKTSPIHFSFVRVFDAGHMVPMDQPAAASALIHTFIFNEKFV